MNEKGPILIRFPAHSKLPLALKNSLLFWLRAFDFEFQTGCPSFATMLLVILLNIK